MIVRLLFDRFRVCVRYVRHLLPTIHCVPSCFHNRPDIKFVEFFQVELGAVSRRPTRSHLLRSHPNCIISMPYLRIIYNLLFLLLCLYWYLICIVRAIVFDVWTIFNFNRARVRVLSLSIPLFLSPFSNCNLYERCLSFQLGTRWLSTIIRYIKNKIRSAREELRIYLPNFMMKFIEKGNRHKLALIGTNWRSQNVNYYFSIKFN